MHLEFQQVSHPVFSLQFVASKSAHYLKQITIKMPNGVPEQVSKSFSALIPISATLTIVLLIRIIVSFTPFETLQNLIYTVLQL